MPSAAFQPKDLRRVVAQLYKSCAALRDTVSAIRHVPPEDLPDRVDEHIDAIGAFRGTIAPLVRDLAQRREKLSDLPPHLREKLAADIRGCQRKLREIEGEYGYLGDRINRLLADVESDLQGIQRGSKALGSYRRGADTGI